MSRSLKAHLLLLFCTIAWGVTFVVVKDALVDASPLMLNAVRMTIAAILLAVIFHRQLLTLSRGVLWAGFEVGTLLWIGYECQTAGLKYTTASKSAFMTGLSVVLVPVILAVFWRRKVSRWTLLGVFAAFIGLYLLTVPVGPDGRFSLASINRGDLLTMVCSVAFAFQIIFVGRAMRRFPFAQFVVLEIAFCAAWMLASVPLFERNGYFHPTPRVLWATAITSVVCTVAAFIIQGWAQQFTPPTHTALIFAMEPVFGGLTSYLVLGDSLGWRGYWGAALILAGVLVSELKGTVQHPEAELAEEVQ